MCIVSFVHRVLRLAILRTQSPLNVISSITLNISNVILAHGTRKQAKKRNLTSESRRMQQEPSQKEQWVFRKTGRLQVLRHRNQDAKLIPCWHQPANMEKDETNTTAVSIDTHPHRQSRFTNQHDQHQQQPQKQQQRLAFHSTKTPSSTLFLPHRLLRRLLGHLGAQAA